MSPFWKKNLKTEADRLQQKISQADTNAFAQHLNRHAQSRIRDFMTGVAAYHAHPYQRSLPPAQQVWQDGSTQLLDFGGPQDGPLVLAVPSLINKGYILDLSEKRSLLRHLTQKGCRVFMLDWGSPGPIERGFSLDDYILKRLHRAVVELVSRFQRAPHLLGYCMGGNLCLGYSHLFPFAVQSLILLATPWNFHADGAMAQRLQAIHPLLDRVLSQQKQLPVDILQSLFASLDPIQIQDKFIKFAQLNPKTEKARSFVALEDWLNDGVPLTESVARSCLFDWFHQNTPATRQWKIAGQTIMPEKISIPAYLLIPQNDRIVPPQSALALSQSLPHATVKRVSSGHITMVSGSRARSQTYTPITKWLMKKKFT